MNYRALTASVLGAMAVCLIGVAIASSAPPPPPHPGPPPPPPPPPVLTVKASPGHGMTVFPDKKYSAVDLAGFPQHTFTVNIGGTPTTETGPYVSDVLANAGLTYIAACSNDELRYWIAASADKGAAAVVGAGEIDPFYGNHLTILSMTENGTALKNPRLVVSTDATDARDVAGVKTVTVGRAPLQLATSSSACNPAGDTPAVTPPPAVGSGSIIVRGDVAIPRTLTWAQLQALPQVSQTDTFMQGSNTQMRSEVGPTLYDVVSASEPTFNFCSPNDDARFFVVVTAQSDGFAAVISWDEIAQARNGVQSLLSLIQGTPPAPGTSTQAAGPRLTMPGDVHGGRYVTGSTVVSVFRADGDGPPAPGCHPPHPPHPPHPSHP